MGYADESCQIKQDDLMHFALLMLGMLGSGPRVKSQATVLWRQTRKRRATGCLFLIRIEFLQIVLTEVLPVIVGLTVCMNG